MAIQLGRMMLLGLAICLLFLLQGTRGNSGFTGLPLSEGPIFGPQQEVTLRLTFAGDLMAHTPNFKVADYDRIHVGIRQVLQGDDLSFVNLETPVDAAAPYQTYPLFNVHAEYVEAAVRAGFDVFALANNHSWDRFGAGTQATLAVFARLAASEQARTGRLISYSGLRAGLAPFDREAWHLEIWRTRGVKIGFVSIAEWINIPSHDGSVYQVDYSRPEIRQAFLNWFRLVAPSVDLCIVSLHSGVEYQNEPTSLFRSFAGDLTEAGADIIWAHHPHVLQPWYGGRTTAGESFLVMPSMGNYVSGQSYMLGPADWGRERARTGDSALFQVDVRVSQAEAGGGVKLDFTRLAPILISSFRGSNGEVYVRTYADLLANLKGPWLNYYHARFDWMASRFPGVRQALDAGASLSSRHSPLVPGGALSPRPQVD